MSVTLPTGWTTFTGGATIPILCGEPQDCPEPPCGEIPPLVITPTNPSGGVPTELQCHPDGYQLVLEVTGGVPPFIWASSTGNLAVTEIRTATIDIAHDMNEILSDFDEKVGNIAFFKPHYFSFSGMLSNPHAGCSAYTPNDYAVSATVDVRLRSYDCLKRHITEIRDDGAEAPDNLYPDYPIPDDAGNLLSNPIGTVIGDRTCDLFVDWPQVDPPTGSHPLSDPEHWSVSANGCAPSGEPGNVSVHVTAALAGKDGVHGTIHSGAPAFDEVKNIPMPITSTGNPGWLDPDTGYIFDYEGTNYLDVRTQVQVDTDCCVVPAGEEITVTVVDAQGVVAIIVIPVVEPTP